MYYIISTLTTVGYGDISTYTCGERIFGGILLLFGIMGYSIALTSVSNYIKKMNSKTEEFENKRKILDEISMNSNIIKKNLYEKVLRHLKYQDNEKNVNNIIIENLPTGLRNNLLLSMYKNIIDNFMFFKNLNNTDFVVQILLLFKPVLALKNDILIKDGDLLEEMIFVKKGKLNLEVPVDISDKYEFGELKNSPNNKNNYNFQNPINSKKSIQQTSTFTKFYRSNSHSHSNEENSSKEEEDPTEYINILILHENEHFGVCSVSFNKKSPLRVRVRSKKAELLFLNKKDIFDISQSYPQIWKKINKKSIHNFQQIENLIVKTLQIYYMSNGIKHEIFNNENDMFDIEEENSDESFDDEDEDEDKDDDIEISKNLNEARENMISNMNQSYKQSHSNLDEKSEDEENDINNAKTINVDENKESSSSFCSSSSGVSNFYKKKTKVLTNVKSQKSLLGIGDEQKLTGAFYSKKSFQNKFTLNSINNNNNNSFYTSNTNSNHESGYKNMKFADDSSIENKMSNIQETSSENSIEKTIINANKKNLNNEDDENNENNNKNINLTPYKSFEINNEIYPNEEFIFSNISKNNSDLTTNSNQVKIPKQNNNNINNNTNNNNNNNYNITINENKEILLPSSKSINENNFIISSNEINFFIKSSYDNINELSGNKYLKEKNLQEKVKNLVKNKKSIMIKTQTQTEKKKKKKKNNKKKNLFIDENNNNYIKNTFTTNINFNNNHSLYKKFNNNNNSDSQDSDKEHSKNDLKINFFGKKMKSTSYNNLDTNFANTNIEKLNSFESIKNSGTVKSDKPNNINNISIVNFSMNNNEGNKLLNIINTNIEQNLILNEERENTYNKNTGNNIAEFLNKALNKKKKKTNSSTNLRNNLDVKPQLTTKHNHNSNNFLSLEKKKII
jgi:hypothetical protein